MIKVIYHLDMVLGFQLNFLCFHTEILWLQIEDGLTHLNGLTHLLLKSATSSYQLAMALAQLVAALFFVCL